MNKSVERAMQLIKQSEWKDTKIPDLEVGDVVKLSDVWDGNGAEPEESYSYQLDSDNWIDYSFLVVEKAENPFDTKIKILSIEIV